MARHRDHVQIRAGERRVVDGRGRDAGKVRFRQVARVPSGLLDRLCLFRVAAGEGDVVPARGEQAAEGRTPRPGTDNRRPHERLTKSIETGTPSSWKRSRSWFSTQ